MSMNPPAPPPPKTAAIKKEVSRHAEAIIALLVFIAGLVLGRLL
jgi:hypothetical protein